MRKWTKKQRESQSKRMKERINKRFYEELERARQNLRREVK